MIIASTKTIYLINKMESKAFLTEAYKRYYYSFIKKAIDLLGNETDKAFDCVQEIVLRLLDMNYPFESMEHARAIIYKSILWECNHIKNLRKKWGAFREFQYDFSNPDVIDSLSDAAMPPSKGSLDYWPQSNRYFNHINKLNPYHQKLIKLHMQGVGNVEAVKLLGKSINRNTLAASKDNAFKMLRGFRVASKLRNPLERSKLRQGSDDRTDKIMEMTAAGISDKIIAEQLGLSIGNVRCRRFDRKKLLNKINNGNKQ